MKPVYCETCYNTGWVNCYCGGDLCVCENNGEELCPVCDGMPDDDEELCPVCDGMPDDDDFFCEEIDE